MPGLLLTAYLYFTWNERLVQLDEGTAALAPSVWL